MKEITDDDLRAMWRKAGGKFVSVAEFRDGAFDRSVTCGDIPESSLLPFLRNLVAVERLSSELCDALDRQWEDIGGSRPAKEILEDLGPACDRAEGR